MPTELKPCPFCGGEADVVKRTSITRHPVMRGRHIEHHTYIVRCRTCQCQTAEHAEDTGAVDAWNKRFPPRKTKREILNKHVELTEARRKLFANKEKTNDQI